MGPSQVPWTARVTVGRTLRGVAGSELADVREPVGTLPGVYSRCSLRVSAGGRGGEVMMVTVAE